MREVVYRVLCQDGNREIRRKLKDINPANWVAQF